MYFGEQALLKGKPRNAWVRSSTDMELGVINGKVFKECDLGSKLFQPKRQAVDKTDQPPPVEDVIPDDGNDYSKTEEERDLLAKGIGANKKLGEVVELTEDLCEALANKAFKRPMEKGTKVIEEGSTDATE